MAPVSAISRRTLADSRIRTLSFALVFLAYAYVQAVAYRDSYQTLAERRAFAASFGNDKAIRVFYGLPHDLLTVNGYAAWRVGGTLAIFAAIWGVLAPVRALRAEEESGRQELVLAGIVSRGSFVTAALGALALELAALWLALTIGLVAAGLSVAGSAYLALSVVSPIPVFVGVGTLASQLFSTRRAALAASFGLVTLAIAGRAVADTVPGLGWLRWLTPLGWAEQLRPFAGPQIGVVALPLIAAAMLVAVGVAVFLRRDIGTGLIHTADSAPPRLALLSSPTAQALRGERGGLIAWAVGIGSVSLVIGLLANSFSRTTLPQSLRREVHKLGGAGLTTPSGALATYFLIFILTGALFACAQVAGARREEAEQRLETLLALPVSRRGWLGGRLLIAAAGTACLGLLAGVVAWAGAASQGAPVSLVRLLEAGVNCVPVSLLFLGVSALAFSLWPRASTGIGYGVVAAAFLWDLVGSLLGLPAWTLGLSPFHHVALVPAQPFALIAAVVMAMLALVLCLLSLWLFERRDLVAE